MLAFAQHAHAARLGAGYVAQQDRVHLSPSLSHQLAPASNRHFAFEGVLGGATAVVSLSSATSSRSGLFVRMGRRHLAAGPPQGGFICRRRGKPRVVTTKAGNEGRGPFVRFTRHATEAIVLAHHVRWPAPYPPHEATVSGWSRQRLALEASVDTQNCSYHFAQASIFNCHLRGD